MDSGNPLTHLETRVLSAIEKYIRSEGVAPTIAELAAELRLKSKGTVHRYVQSLIAKGHLERHGNGWRGLRIVGLDLPDKSSEKPSNVQRLPAPHRAGSLSHLKPDNNVDRAVALPEESKTFTRGDFRIPLLGRIAAGQPIEAIEDTRYLDLAEFFIGPDRYALRVTGNSMIDAGILDGDTVILRKQDQVRAGDIVVALIDGQEATLKRLGRYEKGMVELIPENSEMEPMLYAAHRISFQGVLVGQLRSY
ncbi:MAG: transcriptional repressor LexA [Granulosicoccus sp.]